MLLTLYSTKSDSNVINKELENALNIQIIARSDFDIINPQIRLSKIYGVNFQDFNYCHIPDLNRYYFINQVSAINADIFSFECECDVLESYKADILASNARFMRQIKTGDYYDGSIDSSVVKTVSKFDSNKGFDGESSMILTTVGA